MDYFWDQFHWVSHYFLLLPKEEGREGLVHLARRGASFHLEFVQGLLTGLAELRWRSLCILQQVGDLRLDLSLFPIHSGRLDVSLLAPFYRSVFSVWTLLESQR